MDLHDHPIVLFDGVCNFCNAMVNFIIKQDSKKVFRFAALQSESGQRLQKQYNIDAKKIDSFILIDEKGIHHSSTAGLRLYNKLPWYWKWTQVGWIIPRVIRDAIYAFVARNRYTWFGKKEECMMPNKDVRDRFFN